MLPLPKYAPLTRTTLFSNSIIRGDPDKYPWGEFAEALRVFNEDYIGYTPPDVFKLLHSIYSQIYAETLNYAELKADNPDDSLVDFVFVQTLLQHEEMVLEIVGEMSEDNRNILEANGCDFDTTLAQR